jgi:phospholipase A-2-activating protein
MQPCVSVWAVAAGKNGDILVGGSDGLIRIFTTNPAHFASAEEIAAFGALLSSSAIPSYYTSLIIRNQVGDIDKSKLAGVEALEMPGIKEGEVKMIRIGAIVEAYQVYLFSSKLQWSSSSGSWQKIGEVVDAVGNNRKQLFMGIEYDYVFDVELEDGAPLKLPYNRSGKNEVLT